ncbi:hypothetical protein [Dictyobacter aurantiacus]|uniref:Uncharacterized protein n=1 Tax=Dictyobacter aurantiacus TaxID=1936993 RepID=A0A401ZLW6_9CHLR|nr:hypothetical protein [Dictyobacter aurantiacus]GCE07822.1 hypothetical protein KDAU_51510 [Dictyobacter aurantiacus]
MTKTPQPHNRSSHTALSSTTCAHRTQNTPASPTTSTPVTPEDTARLILVRCTTLILLLSLPLAAITHNLTVLLPSSPLLLVFSYYFRRK